MPRTPRITLPRVPLHFIQRATAVQRVFFFPQESQNFLGWLQKHAADSGWTITAYVLMTKHVHLALTPTTSKDAGRLMKSLGQRDVQYVNRVYRCTGTV